MVNMIIHSHAHLLEALEGGDDDHARQDWGGIGYVLETWKKADRKQKADMIEAMRAILEDGAEHPVAAARVLYLANAFHLRELEPSVKKLSSLPVAQTEQYLREQIENYYIITLKRSRRNGTHTKYRADGV